MDRYSQPTSCEFLFSIQLIFSQLTQGVLTHEYRGTCDDTRQRSASRITYSNAYSHSFRTLASGKSFASGWPRSFILFPFLLKATRITNKHMAMNPLIIFCSLILKLPLAPASIPIQWTLIKTSPVTNFFFIIVKLIFARFTFTCRNTRLPISFSDKPYNNSNLKS